MTRWSAITPTRGHRSALAYGSRSTTAAEDNLNRLIHHEQGRYCPLYIPIAWFNGAADQGFRAETWRTASRRQHLDRTPQPLCGAAEHLKAALGALVMWEDLRELTLLLCRHTPR